MKVHINPSIVVEIKEYSSSNLKKSISTYYLISYIPENYKSSFKLE